MKILSDINGSMAQKRFGAAALCDVKENAIHRCRSPSSIVLRSSSLSVLSMVGRGQYGHSNRSVVMQPQTQQTVIYCVF